MIQTQDTAYRAFAITPGAGDLVRVPNRGILVQAAGNVTVTVEDEDGDDLSLVFTALTAGQHLKIVPKKVTAATATVCGLFV